MDRAIFFAKARARLFGGALKRSQVEGVTAILDECVARDVTDERALAYVLATAYHETGRAMRPVREVGRGRGRPYGVPDPQTGLVYDGRGYVQITWKANYQRLGDRLGVDLVDHPDLALDPKIAAAILVVGMKEGLFTGRALAQSFTSGLCDWTGARRIVNGQDRAVEIAAYARAFHDCLTAAARPALSVQPQENLMKSIKGYRTLAFNAVIAAVGLAQSLDWGTLLGAEHAGIALAAVSLANMLLRASTNGPVGPARAAS